MGGKAVITTALSVWIGAKRDRVWRAITDPTEVVCWDESALALLDPANGYPSVGSSLRWRYALGNVSLVLCDRPLEMVPAERLRSRVSLGSFRFDQLWQLVEGEQDDQPGTRLGLRLAAPNSMPVLGDVADRFDVRRMAAQYVDARIRAVQKWCSPKPPAPAEAKPAKRRAKKPRASGAGSAAGG